MADVLPLYERINLLAKELTRYRQTRGDDVALVELTTNIYTLAKEVEEKGAHTTYHVELAVFHVVNEVALSKGWDCNYQNLSGASLGVTQRLKRYEEVSK